MNNSKLLHFLGYLRKDEVKPFVNYLKSPYFNRRLLMAEFFEVLSVHLHKKKGSLDVEALYKKHFPKRPLTDLAFRKFCSELLKHLWNFWAVHRLEQNDRQKRISLLQELNERGEEKYFPKLYSKAIEDLWNSPRMSLNYFEEAYEIEFAMGKYRHRTGHRDIDLNLEAINTALVNSFHLRYLRLSNSAATLAAISGIPSFSTSSQLPHFISALESGLSEVHYLVRLYFYLYRITLPPIDHSVFFHLKKELFAHVDELNRSDQDDLFAGVVNYCIRKMNAGEEKYERELLSIFQIMVQKEMWIENGKMSQSFFKNLVSLGSRLGEFEWVETLIAQYGKALMGEHTESALLYNLGVFAFFRRDFSSCSKHLHQILAKFDDIFYALDARAFLLRTFFHTKDLDGMDALCHSFRMFLERQEGVSQRHRENYKAFIRFFRRLYFLLPHEKAKLEKLKTDILNAPAISGKRWLLESLNDLEEAE